MKIKASDDEPISEPNKNPPDAAVRNVGNHGGNDFLSGVLLLTGLVNGDADNWVFIFILLIGCDIIFLLLFIIWFLLILGLIGPFTLLGGLILRLNVDNSTHRSVTKYKWFIRWICSRN